MNIYIQNTHKKKQQFVTITLWCHYYSYRSFVCNSLSYLLIYVY